MGWTTDTLGTASTSIADSSITTSGKSILCGSVLVEFMTACEVGTSDSSGTLTPMLVGGGVPIHEVTEEEEKTEQLSGGLEVAGERLDSNELMAVGKVRSSDDLDRRPFEMDSSSGAD